MVEPRDLKRCWQAILGRLKFEVSPHAYATWLEDTSPLRVEGQTFIAQARSAFSCDHLNRQLAHVIRLAAGEILGEGWDVYFVPAVRASDEDDERPGNRGAFGQARTVIGRLNCGYTLDRYLAAEGNRLALHCCTSLLAGEFSMSPVVIYGAPGMGKSHLLHAVVARAAERGWPVACMSAEELTNRFMGAVRRREVEDFQEAMRGVRLFAVDDLQYLAGKKGMQDELVHTIDAVTNGGGHVLVASERHPGEIDLPERLASRLAAGIATRVEPFVAGERRTYIERQARELRVALPPWSVERVAHIEAPSVRVLQGAVNAAAALQSAGMLDERRLDMELTRLCVAEVAPAAGRGDRATLELVSQHFQVAVEDLIGRSRKGSVAEARSVAAAALRAHGRSLSQVGDALGGRDRSTVKGLAERGQEILAQDAALLRRLTA